MSVREANFDGIVGPTHNYAGLSRGNEASTTHVGAVSRPREAVLQGLYKAKVLADMGLAQGVLPPVARPSVSALRRLGFSGSDEAVVEAAAKVEPALLATVSSASSMWTANAATVAPSADTPDKKVHFTPANLVSKLHRALEPNDTARILKATFASDAHFVHHAPLLAHPWLGDEGSANHTRLAEAHGAPGHHLFVYGHDPQREGALAPTRYPARQTLAASRAVARLHGLTDAQVTFAQQRPEAIDAGVFHNDVICVGNERLLLVHELAFVDQRAVIARLRDKVPSLEVLTLSAAEVPLEDVVRSYLFNAQLVTMPDDEVHLIAPTSCAQTPSAAAAIARWVSEENALAAVHYVDLGQSMSNGGGPACLRLRVPLTDEQRFTVNDGSWMTDAQYNRLVAWATQHYRETLAPRELGDPQLLKESRTALDELTQILGLGSIYDFQRG